MLPIGNAIERPVVYKNKKKTKVNGLQTLKANMAVQPEWFFIIGGVVFTVSAAAYVVLSVFDKIGDALPSLEDLAGILPGIGLPIQINKFLVDQRTKAAELSAAEQESVVRAVNIIVDPNDLFGLND